MNNYFKKDFKRAFFSKYNIIAILIVFIVSIIELLYMKIDGTTLLLDGVSGMLIVLNFGKLAILTMICPLVISLPYVSSYIKDKESKFIYLILTREKKENYLRTRLIVNGIISFLVLFIPLMIIYSLLLLILGMPKELIPEGKIVGVFYNVYYNNTLLYPILCIIGMSLFGAAYGTFALGISTFINNSYLSVIIPVVIYIWSNLITPMFGGFFGGDFNISLVQIADISMSQSLIKVLIYNGVLFLAGLYLFYYKNLKKEACNE